mmetsp:Transcript_16720/g.41121  ORF Transcript_16720/g.41121 Transcript_16720/m.41121 type:complete len:223 (-) Transcript_16720:424-1092(-)
MRSVILLMNSLRSTVPPPSSSMASNMAFSSRGFGSNPRARAANLSSLASISPPLSVSTNMKASVSSCTSSAFMPCTFVASPRLLPSLIGWVVLSWRSLTNEGPFRPPSSPPSAFFPSPLTSRLLVPPPTRPRPSPCPPRREDPLPDGVSASMSTFLVLPARASSVDFPGATAPEEYAVLGGGFQFRGSAVPISSSCNVRGSSLMSIPCSTATAAGSPASVET